MTEEVWKWFGKTLADLHSQGSAIADRDLLIACTAKVYDLILVKNLLVTKLCLVMPAGQARLDERDEAELRVQILPSKAW